MKFSNLSIVAFSVALTVQPLMAQEMKPKPAGDAAPMMAMDKPTFVKMVTSANEFEIRSSELVKQNADQAGIKSAADMIIADHRKAGDARINPVRHCSGCGSRAGFEQAS